MSETEPVITAYAIHPPTGMDLVPATIEREWMEVSERFAYRCLPLSIANQNGWFIRNPTSFTAYWNGGPNSQDTVIEFGEPAPEASAASISTFEINTWTDTQPDPRIMSHFGNGVITFSIPYLFRTPPQVNLWVKGPANWIKDGAQALEGIVEADWSPATFTMNWKITAPQRRVRFQAGEPICMIVPVPRGYIEQFVPRTTLLSTNPELEKQYRDWQDSRSNFLTDLWHQRGEAMEKLWQKDYFQGQTMEGERFAGHQTRLFVKPFIPTDQTGD